MEILFSKEYTIHLSIYKKYLYTDPADRNYVIKLLRKPALHAFYQTRRGDSPYAVCPCGWGDEKNVKKRRLCY